MKQIIQVLLLLAVSGDVISGSAWVLWVEIDTAWEPNEIKKKWDRSDTNWELLDAFEDKKTCQSGLNEEIKKIITAQSENDKFDVMNKVEGNKVKFAFFFKNKKKQKTDVIQRSEIYRYICVPDTIDPKKQ